MRNLETKREIKKELRKKILRERKSLTQEAWQEYSECIADSVVSHAWFLAAETIYCYVDYNKEAGTQKIIEEALKQKKRVCVPKVHGERMKFYPITSREDLAPGAYGILEPKDGLKPDDTVDTKTGLMIMPGVVFDLNRNRIGYGGGYYDRYLDEHPGLPTIAVAFSLQVTEHVPSETTDKKPDILITETGMIHS